MHGFHSEDIIVELQLSPGRGGDRRFEPALAN